MSRKRLPEPDVMRTIAISIIIFHHLTDYTFNYYHINFMGLNADMSFINRINANLAVGTFIFISGMLHSPSFEAGENTLSVSGYVRKRYLRLFPLYLLSFLLFMLETGYYPGTRFTVIHLLGLQVLLATGPRSMYPTIWFIGLLVSYEALYLITLKYGTGYLRKIVIISGAFAACLFVKFYAGIIDERFFEYYAVFWIGIFCSGPLFGLNRRIKTLFVAAAIVAAYIYARNFYPFFLDRFLKSQPSWTEYFITVNVIMLGFIIFTHEIGTIAASSKNIVLAFFRHAAFASYCVYLFHRHVWYVMLWVYRPDSGFIRLIYLAAVGIPLIALISWLIQTFYDRLIGKLTALRSPSVALRSEVE